MLSVSRFIFGLGLWEIEGFAKSIFEWMGLHLEVPSYSTPCRRLSSLSLIRCQGLQFIDRIHLAVDATGLKAYGEREWKVRTHGVGKRQTWRKFHLAVDVANNRILGLVLPDLKKIRSRQSPLRRGANIQQHGNSKKKSKIRDILIRGIRKLGRKARKKRVKYHRCSIAEAAMYRFKALLGDRIQFRKSHKQWAEVLVKVNVLNKMKTPITCA